MIITRTPYRISFFGGGTDYPAWYNQEGHEGIVLSSTINKYCHIMLRELPPFFDYRFRVRYYKNEEVSEIGEIEHPVVREVAGAYGMTNGFEVVHSGDLPARSGLGSSSSFSVGFINAVRAFKGQFSTKRELALEAIDFEQNVIGEAVGSQDQVAAAFGGLNVIRFGVSGDIQTIPLAVSLKRMDELQSHLMLCFTGISRTAADIAVKKIASVQDRASELQEMQALCRDAVGVLSSDQDITEFGRMLDRQWHLKKSLANGVTNPVIDDIYSKAISAGAIGAKLLGAGGGGFILFFAPPEYQEKIRLAMNDFLIVPFRFEDLGSQIIHFSRN